MRTLVFLLVLNVFPAILVCGDETASGRRARVLSHEESDKIRRDYLGILTEIETREHLAAIRKNVPNPPIKFIEEVYHLKTSPVYRNMSDRDLRVKLTEIEDAIEGGELLTYGNRDIQDIFAGPPLPGITTTIPIVTDPLVLQADSAVVAIVKADGIDQNGGKWILKTAPLDSVKNTPLCSVDDFYHEPVAQVIGTGFLVADSVIATAGHNVDKDSTGLEYQPFLDSVYFVFDYVMETDGTPRTVFGNEQVFRADSVLADHDESGTDWALIRLARNPHRTPLDYRKPDEPPVAAGTPLYMIGHPHGRPQTYHGNATVTDTSSCWQFKCDLDNYPHNSGSPVFNTADNRVEGILAQDVGNYLDCVCLITAVAASEEGFLGASVTRTWEFAEFLKHPEEVAVETRIDYAEVTMGGTTAELSASHPSDLLPWSSLGMKLLKDAHCHTRYYPTTGSAWAVELHPTGVVFMRPRCPK
jgi:hypothetical protein